MIGKPAIAVRTTDVVQLRRHVTNTLTYHISGETLLGTYRTLSLRISHGTTYLDQWKS